MEDVVAECVRLSPRVIVADVTADGAESARLVERLVRDCAGRLVVLINPAMARAVDMYRAGASGVLCWDCDEDQLREAVRVTRAGALFASPPILAQLVAQRSGEGDGPTSALAPLTERERDVVDQLLQGHSNREIAGRLNLAEQTVKSHLARVMVKWGARDRVQVVLLGIRQRWREEASG